MWLAYWGIGFALYAMSRFIPEKDNGEIEAINSLLGDKGFVKFYNCDSRTYGIELNLGSKFEDLEKLKGQIENAVKNEVKVINSSFDYFIQLIEANYIPALVPFKFIDSSKMKGFKIAIGIGENGSTYLDLSRAPHTLIAGTTGWGKSVFLNSFIIQLLHNHNDIELELFDFKGGVELGAYKNLKQTKTFIIRPEQAAARIKELYSEIEERYDLISESNSRTIDDYNKKSTDKMVRKIVILEEFTILLGQNQELTDTLIKSLAIARAAGVHYIFTSQRFSSKIIDGNIKSNIDNRICFHTSDGINSKIILDEMGAEKLNIKGRAIYSNGSEKVFIQSFYAKDSDINKVVFKNLKPTKESKCENQLSDTEAKNKNSKVIIWG
jgi:hypothetical protein